MERIFLSLCTIFLINQRVSSISNTVFESDDIQELQDYIKLVYNTKLEDVQIEPSIIFDTVVPFIESMEDSSITWMEWLRSIQNFNNSKIDVAKTLMNNIGNDKDFRDLRAELYQHITNIEFFYEEGLEFYDYIPYSNNTLMIFINSVLHHKNNLPQTLFHIYGLIMRPTIDHYADYNFMSFVLQYVKNNHEHFCDRFVSPQMQAYNLLMYILQIELKGFETITQAFLLQFSLDHINRAQQYEVVTRDSKKRLKTYFEMFIDVIRNFPRDIRRCDVKNPQLSVNAIALDGLFQVIVRSECDIRTKLQSVTLDCGWGSCEDLISDSSDQFVVGNCKTYKSIEGCPVEKWHGRLRFSWWKTDSETVGHINNCFNNLYKLDSKWSGWFYNDVCLCSVNFTDNPLIEYRFDRWEMNFTIPKVIRISTEPQLADIAKNMIVVGVKFVLHNNAIHLQIKQAKLPRGAYFATESSWKPVNIDNNNNTISISYGVFHDKRNILYLDHVLVDPNHVVTGVRFQEAEGGKGFELHVHSTRFNYNTGQLDGSHKWHKPGANPVNAMDYQRNRMEIVLNDPDVPTMAPYNHPDLISNKFIQFQHSSIHKDAGYHVVPFFDAQPVETSPEFPLSGIGLFHRGLDGFGGYIAPQLFTQDLTWAIESLFQGWKQLNKRHDINTLVAMKFTDIGDHGVTKCGRHHGSNMDSDYNWNEVNQQ